MGDLIVLRLIMDTGVTDNSSSFQPNTYTYHFLYLQHLLFHNKGNLGHDRTNDFMFSKQSQHYSEESFSTLLQREEAFMWSENTRLIFFFLWNAAVQTARVNCLSSLL